MFEYYDYNARLQLNREYAARLVRDHQRAQRLEVHARGARPGLRLLRRRRTAEQAARA